MATNFNTENINKPTPRWYSRMEKAFLIIFIPTAISLIQSWKFSNELQALRLQLLISVGLTALIKGIGMLLGNDEIYVDPTKKDPS